MITNTKKYNMAYLKTLIITIILIMNVEVVKSQQEKNIKDTYGLSPGEMAPMFKALDADSNIFVLEDAIKEGPVVIIFYRGHWCPVCNQHLSIIQDSLKLIEELGATVIAVSPEKPEFLNVMGEKIEAQFTLLYDKDYKIAEAYDVNFKPDKKQLFTYNVLMGGKLKESHSNDSQLLPIPATYIIDEEGKIIWRQFDRNYKNRSSVKDILNALQEK